MAETFEANTTSTPAERQGRIENPRLKFSAWDLLLVIILALAAYFRFIGLDWDQDQHLHPDERFLTMVETSIAPVDSLGEYFNTNVSSLNPNNRGYTFYVYGTLPLFIVRYIAEWVGQTGYSEIYLVGRAFSAASDLLTVVLVYLAAGYLYRRKAVSLLAAAFSAFAVLQIQLSHYSTVDIFANFCSLLTFTVAVRILRYTRPERVQHPTEQTGDDAEKVARALLTQWGSILPYILFGVAFGMALASKISAAPLALLLPGAVLLNYLKFTPQERRVSLPFFIRNIVVAAIVTILVFRIFQPYAFKGPGFLGMIPNEGWIDSLVELSGQSSGEVDFPPALQWARRSVTFGYENMVKWGLGLPLGLLTTAGFLWMLARIIKGEWFEHALLWGWTALFFVYQSIQFTSSMRYFLLIYPMLAIIAAWAVVQLWSLRSHRSGVRRAPYAKIAAAVLGAGVLLSTLAWAFAFSRIYARPVTRIAASDWIYQNIPGPINLHINTGDGLFNQPVSHNLTTDVTYENPLVLAFTAQYDGAAANIVYSHLLQKSSTTGFTNLNVSISEEPDGSPALASANTSSDFSVVDNDPRGGSYSLEFYPNAWLTAGKTYYLHIGVQEAGSVLQMAGPITLASLDELTIHKQALLEAVELLSQANDSMITINPGREGDLTGIYFPHIVDWSGLPGGKTLEVSVIQTVDGQPVVTTTTLTDSFVAAGDDPRGGDYLARFDEPIHVMPDRYISIQLRVLEGEGLLAVYGSKQVLESTWDDSLPYNLYGASVFDYYNGLYRTELNFEMYWDDNADKLERFQLNLDQADTIFISSNRQWGTTVRVPERYPLTSAYYRALLGCPEDKEIFWCYAVAEPGMFESRLGFELVQVFQSDPQIGPFKFNTQFAEEAFTVYDHPKVLIFRKTEDYSSQRVQEILGTVDLSQVIHLTPKQASEYRGNLVLSDKAWAEQQNAGTWRELFKRSDLVNQHPWVGLIVWYLVILLVGWVMLPLTRLVFGGLHDRGYPLSRLFGLMVLAFMVWILGSSGIHFTKLTITLCFAVLLLVNLVLFLRARQQILAEFKDHWRYYLLVEGIFLAVFAFDLLIRWGNPDLWHPYKGGEKPMDLSYFTAVLKSVRFPPYDPWYAGGYINYYYYGFVLLAVPVKWLGMMPTIAYNFILPTLMAFLAMGVFSAGSNITGIITSASRREGQKKFPDWLPFGLSGLLGGLASTILTIFVGNLGTIRLIWHGLMRLAAPGGIIEDSNLFTRILWTVQGLGNYLKGAGLPYAAGDWYWIPSRVYPHEPITEFPLFTFLYADLHAHMIALPITALALCWAISFIKYRFFNGEKPVLKDWLVFGLVILGGALIIGALRPTNTWDTPTYLTLAVVAAAYRLLRTRSPSEDKLKLGAGWKRGILTAATVVLLIVLTFALYAPFGKWYGQAYNSIAVWEGERSPAWSYLTHWGLFLFLIFPWMFWETRQWMAETPLSALNRLRPYRFAIQAAFALLFCAILATIFLKIGIGWMALLGAFWALILLLRPGQPDMKRVVLFLIGTALVLTLAVEVIVLEGDLGRMNTVFKFYLQAWTLLAVSAAAALIWLYPVIVEKWKIGWRNAWSAAAVVLFGAAVMFTLMGGIDKIRDRMTASAPHSLDGMTYMATSTYWQNDLEMDLGQDYQAILWMQQNIDGSPVIVEANTPEYMWSARYTVYTGLPGVVGWNWHQRQQRGIVSADWVTSRILEVDSFYRTLERQPVEQFLEKYNVQYIVVGQLEAAYYGTAGLSKFPEWDGDLWTAVYSVDDTTIYKVLGSE